MSSGNFYESVYGVVRRIPAGKVSSYGRIAAILGAPKAARAVGYALRALKDKVGDPQYDDIPWQRVIGHSGQITIVNRNYGASLQADLLRQEGIEVNDSLKVDMEKYVWEGLSWIEVDDILGHEI